MPDFLTSLFNGSNLTQVVLLILIVGIAWLVLRSVLRLAARVFSLGCFAIVILGLLLLFLNR